MKILIVSQYFAPEATLIPTSLAKSLTGAGHEVRVLTGYPNYPTGRIFEGYKQRWRSYETFEGARVLRVPLWTDHSMSVLRRVLNYTSFALTAATARRFATSVDVIYVYATQMTPAFGPWLWRKLGGAPYVLHVQDLWPDSITGSSLIGGGWKGRIIDAVLGPWLTNVYKDAAAVIGIAPTMVRTLIQRGVQPDRAHLVYNWSQDTAEPRPIQGGEKSGKTRIIFAGNVGDMQDLRTVILAAHQASDAGVELTIVGDGVALPGARILAEELQSTNVRFVGRVPRSEMADHYASADYGLVTLKDLAAFRGTIPSKFQALASHGLPIITTVQGDVSALVEAESIGLTALPEDPHDLERAFRAAATHTEPERRDLSERVLLAYRKWFSEKSASEVVERILQAASQR